MAVQRQRLTMRPKDSLSQVQKQEVQTLVQRTLNKRVELKYFVYGAQPTVTLASPIITSLCDITAGDEDIDRNGDRINYKLLNLKLQIQANSNFNETAYVRCIVFQWLPNTSLTAPTFANILTPTSFANTISYMSAHGHDTRDMWRILFDETYSLNFAYTVPTIQSGVHRDIQINLGPAIKHLQFSGGTTDGTNKLFIGFLSSATTNQPSIWWESKLNFNDP